MDAPEAGEGETADDGGKDLVLHEKGGRHAGEAHDEPHPPALLTPLVFHFDDGRMADSNAQEHGRTDDYTAEIHSIPFVTIVGAKVGISTPL